MLVEVDQGGRTTTGAGTVSLVLADDFEKRDGHQPPGTRDERITGFVPVAVVLPADDVKKVSLAESEFLGIRVVGLVVVEGFDDLIVMNVCFSIKRARQDRKNVWVVSV